MRFEEKTFGGTKQLLKFPDHYVAHTVNISDEGVMAVAGKKIVPMGTILTGEALDDQSISVKDINMGGKQAYLDTGKLIFIANESGVAGNSIKIEIVKPDVANASVNVDSNANKVTIKLATDESKAATTTTLQAIEAINSSEADIVIHAKLSDAATEENIMEAVTETALSGGTARGAGTAIGVLLNNVDVTYGPGLGAMVVHGFIDVKKMPYYPTNEDRAALPQIMFIG